MKKDSLDVFEINDEVDAILTIAIFRNLFKQNIITKRELDEIILKINRTFNLKEKIC